jgi:hypothetical protein
MERRRYTDEERAELEAITEALLDTDPDDFDPRAVEYVGGQDVGYMDLLSELGLK